MDRLWACKVYLQKLLIGFYNVSLPYEYKHINININNIYLYNPVYPNVL